MKRQFWMACVIVAVVVGMVIGAAGRASAVPCEGLVDCSQPLPSAAEAEFVAAVMAAEAAFQSEDAARAASHYAEDAVSMPPGFPPSYGREEIEADFQFLFDGFDLEREFTLADYEVSGNRGVRRAEWTQTLTPTDGGEPFVETGRCVLGFEKIDGEWKVVWEIWNTYE